MRKLFKHVQTGCISALVTLLVIGPAVAEDIEIYQAGNQSTAAVNPNILFILDTSGSMDRTIEVDEVYDPLTDYSLRTGACFDNTRMYPSINSNVDCSSVYTDNYFKISQNQCNRATESFAVTGFYNSTFAQWQSVDEYWGQPKRNVISDPSDPINSDNNYIECAPDQGIHGNGGAATHVNVGGGTEAYTTSSTDEELSWGAISGREVMTIYSGNWMNYKITAGTENRNYLDIMRGVINDLIFSVDDVNIGLMRFHQASWPNGGPVRYPVQDVAINRQAMKDEMALWDHDGYTPLSETLYEAYLYYSGGYVKYGKTSTPPSVNESLADGGIIVESTDPLVEATANPRYKSPVDPDFAGCQKQFIIVLSDGEPTRDTDAEDEIEALPGFVATNGSTVDCSGSGSGSCLDDLAKYMNETGYIAYVGGGEFVGDFNPNTVAEPVKTNTYTIGFGSDIPILEDTASQGGGEYFIAYNATDLLTTLTSIISSITGTHTTFSSPAVSVNAFNRTTNRSDLYFTLFKPETQPHWDGNFKRFKLSFTDTGIPQIIDQNDDPAINGDTGFFSEEALSYWTASADAPAGDGRDTSLGGAASKLFNGTPTSDGRKVYTYLDGATGDLSDPDNRVWRSAPGMREAFGMPAGTTDTVVIDGYNKLIDWVRGIDVDDDYGSGTGGLTGGDGSTTDARPVMGDPLHAQPALVQYGGTDTNPDITAYVATNDGLLHAFSTATGVEQFAFIPKELLGKMKSLYENTGAQKFYGLDGTISPYIIDNDVDGIIEPGNGDKVYIFFGMRRGGSNIYALDVTDRDAPELMWTIRGGPDALGVGVADTSLGDYKDLGQTWSKPTVRIIRLGGDDVPVLIFAGGYDTDQDGVLARTNDDIGRGIYIVNALTGAPLWRMGPDGAADLTNTDMNYSIPSDVSAVDTNGDGYVDHIYVGDMGGQIWRVDIDNLLGESTGTIASIITGGRIADLADDSVISNRRFYYPPAVAIGKDDNDVAYTALVLTSGYRAHPMDDDIQDKIFMIRDTPVNGKPTTYNTVVVNDSTEDLYDATANLIGQGTDSQKTIAKSSLNSANGWFIDLDFDAAEKGLTKALIFAGDIFLTTYEPNDPTVSTNVASCTPQQGVGYLYHIDLFDGQPVKNYETIVNNDGEALDTLDRRVKVARSGIPADPTVIITKEGGARCVGTECDKLDGANLHKTIYWFEDDN